MIGRLLCRLGRHRRPISRAFDVPAWLSGERCHRPGCIAIDTRTRH